MRIDIDHLCKSFDDRRVILDNICFSDEISSLAVIGSSGGGKSTLLRILGGLLPMTSGEIRIDGVNVFSDEKQLFAYRKNIGFVFQKSGLFYHMTGLENIVRPLVAVHGFTEEAAAERAEELLKRFGLEQDSHKFPSELSGGQQQRIAIARAVAPNPQLLLLDEPTSALDPEYTIGVLDMINELKLEGIRFIIVTHEMGFAHRACEKAAFLSGGKMLEYGRSEELFEQPKTPELSSFLSSLSSWS